VKLRSSLRTRVAALGNFAGPFIFGTAIAATVGKGIIQPEFSTTYVILAGLIGAIVWDLITWYFGLASSVSHASIGGIDLIRTIYSKVLLKFRFLPILLFPV
jgi:inorganic phosphate transporter, PiT family